MSKTKHTPGPWQHDGDGYSVWVDMDFSKLICDIRGWGWLSKMGEKKAREAQVANAKLIAASPDLLEMLIELNDTRPADSAYWGSDLNTRVEKAIKKAID